MWPGIKLDGTAIIDFSQWLPGRLCASVLAQCGAFVIQVQSPLGDPMKALRPELCEELDTGKELIALDLKSGKGRTKALQLVAQSSVVIEGFRAGAMEGLGLGYPVLSGARSDIILCSLPGYRRGSALARLPAHDLALEAFTGLLDVKAPARPAVSAVDLITGIAAVTGIVGALREREASGVGAHLELALSDAGIFWSHIAHLTSSTEKGGGNEIFYAADGLPFAACILLDREWDSLWRLLADIPSVSLPAISELPARGSAQLIGLLRDVFSTRPREYWVERLSQAGLAARPVFSVDEALDDPYFAEMIYPRAATVAKVAFPVRVLGDSEPRHVRGEPSFFREARDSYSREASAGAEHDL